MSSIEDKIKEYTGRMDEAQTNDEIIQILDESIKFMEGATAATGNKPIDSLQLQILQLLGFNLKIANKSKMRYEKHESEIAELKKSNANLEGRLLKLEKIMKEMASDRIE